MKFLRPRDLNQALWRLLLAVIAPLLLGALALLALQASDDKRLAQVRLAALAQSLVQTVDAEFERGRAQLEVLAASPQVDAGDWQQMHRFARAIVTDVPGSLIVLVGPDGQVLFNTSARWGDPLPNLWTLGAQNREVLWEGRPLPLSSGNLSRQAFESGQAVYSDLYFGVQVQRPALSMAIPVQRGGVSRYALILSFPPSLLQERVASAVNVPGIRAALLDRRGVVVASNEAAASRLADRATVIRMAPGAATGTYQTVSRDGVELVGAYAVSPEHGFVVRVSQPEGTGLLTSRRTSFGWIALLLAAIVSSVVLAGLFSRKLAKPLRELGDDVLAGRPPPAERASGIAEIDLLAHALREGARAEHERAQEQTRRTVAEHQEAMLRQADRQKDEFLATLAHELRNPLAPIRNSVELIRLRAPADPVVERARATIERQAMHLSRLVDDLLDVSRITLGRIHLRQESVNMVEVAASAVEAVGEAARRAGLTLALGTDDRPVCVRGDVTRLTQCVVNLLNNAIKFTPQGGAVQVRVRREGELAIVEVQDSGVGVAAENLTRIFDLFVQERHSGHGGNTGLGIGLALTRRLVELHGGRIAARSPGLGQGSTFRIELPAIESPADAHPPATQPSRAAAPRPAAALVLVVDDNRDAAETLAELLRMSGYEAVLAHDGQSAVRLAAECGPQAVLLDIGLPDIDGYEACRRIRSQPWPAGRPLLVAVTGWGQQSDQAAAREAGFDAHMTKPVPPDALVALLAERLQQEPGVPA